MKDIKFSFEDLKIYQKSLDFVDLVYETSETFPKKETYGLSSQFQRAAVSISLNIAEGSADTDKQFNRFLQTSRDSVNECVVCSTIAYRRKYISHQKNYELRLNLEELSKMIIGLQKYLRNKRNLS